ncbi:MAG TPA: (2Fe-2S)-binding protein [Acidimicrobiia bacterium]|nr:(2Fe-2S)-binding protein [Acidimicrobiia bacterium]
MSTSSIRAVINGIHVERTIPVRLTLAEFLRDTLGMTGTKVSCELQVCGVCTVLVDGGPVSACAYLAVDIDGRELTTIEGLADHDALHPLQEAFAAEFALQCGYCTPGFIMCAVPFVEEHPDPTDDEVIEYLDGNICRCTGYRSIVAAVQRAAREIAERSA